VIDRADLELFSFVDDPPAALALLQAILPVRVETTTPAFAKSRISTSPNGQPPGARPEGEAT
jgi:hypothetical protein